MPILLKSWESQAPGIVWDRGFVRHGDFFLTMNLPQFVAFVMALYQFINYEGISKMNRTDAIKIIKIINKGF
jgi:hypothetical protein